MKNNFIYKKEFSNIYRKASISSEITTQILYGERFKILSKNKGWIKIKTTFDNYIGFMKDKDYSIFAKQANTIFFKDINYI